MKNEEYRRMDLAPHNVILENREHLSVSGVSEVISFDENQVSLVTSMGILTVGGGKAQSGGGGDCHRRTD